MAIENNINHLSRPIEADYFNEDGFTTRIGCEKQSWHLTIIKELIDNALDAAEQTKEHPDIHITGIMFPVIFRVDAAEQTKEHPDIHVDFDNDILMVVDNGGGISEYVGCNCTFRENPP